MAQLDLIPLKLRRARHAQRARILEQKVCLCKALALSLLDTCLNHSITPHVCTSGASAHAHSVVLRLGRVCIMERLDASLLNNKKKSDEEISEGSAHTHTHFLSL